MTDTQSVACISIRIDVGQAGFFSWASGEGESPADTHRCPECLVRIDERGKQMLRHSSGTLPASEPGTAEGGGS